MLESWCLTSMLLSVFLDGNDPVLIKVAVRLSRLLNFVCSELGLKSSWRSEIRASGLWWWFNLSWVTIISRYKSYQDLHIDHLLILICLHLLLDDSERHNSPQGNVRLRSLRNVSKCKKNWRAAYVSPFSVKKIANLGSGTVLCSGNLLMACNGRMGMSFFLILTFLMNLICFCVFEAIISTLQFVYDTKKLSMVNWWSILIFFITYYAALFLKSALYTAYL